MDAVLLILGAFRHLVGAVDPVVCRYRFVPAALISSVQAAVAYVFSDDDDHRAAEFYRMYVSALVDVDARIMAVSNWQEFFRCHVPGTASRRTTTS